MSSDMELDGDKHQHGQGNRHRGHHDRMAADFQRRFRVSLVLTVPILVLSPLIQTLPGLEEVLRILDYLHAKGG